MRNQCRHSPQILDGPAEFPFAEDRLGYYAVYFRGPDGMKFECVHMPGLGHAFRWPLRGNRGNLTGNFRRGRLE